MGRETYFIGTHTGLLPLQRQDSEVMLFCLQWISAKLSAGTFHAMETFGHPRPVCKSQRVNSVESSHKILHCKLDRLGHCSSNGRCAGTDFPDSWKMFEAQRAGCRPLWRDLSSTETPQLRRNLSKGTRQTVSMPDSIGAYIMLKRGSEEELVGADSRWQLMESLLQKWQSAVVLFILCPLGL